jgi:hypothetical protein
MNISKQSLKEVIERTFLKCGLRGFDVEITPNLYDNKYRLFFYKKYEDFCSYTDFSDTALIAQKISRITSETIVHPVPTRTIKLEKTFRVSTRYWVSSPNIVMRRK